MRRDGFCREGACEQPALKDGLCLRHGEQITPQVRRGLKDLHAALRVFGFPTDRPADIAEALRWMGGLR